MTAEQLIEKLERVPATAEVVLHDAETDDDLPAEFHYRDGRVVIAAED